MFFSLFFVNKITYIVLKIITCGKIDRIFDKFK